MAVSPGVRIELAPAVATFSNIPAGVAFTTANFELPSGVGRLEYTAYDPNNPGVVTLTDPNSETYTLQTSLGDIPGFTGTLWFQTLGGKTFNVKTTNGAQNISIFFNENMAMR